ncbi:MAG: hypothetical protein H0T42_07570 [Deltaproteobacteria bacterium]|nr:hypothetical protein [Deltaproteobacteria bacterium]
MAGSRVPIVVGILAIGGGITWLALRDQGSNAAPPASGSAGGSSAQSGSGKGAISAPEGPTLGSGATPNAFDTPRPGLPDAGPIDAPSHRDVFAAQPRDPAWATRTEDELELRFRKLKLTAVKGVECHADQCELTLSGPVETVSTTIAKLETPAGLSAVASSIVLGGPERTGDQMTMRVYAVFERAPEPPAP